MARLRIKIQSVRITDKEYGNLTAKFVDPRNPQEWVKLSETSDAWMVDVDRSVMNMLANTQTMHIVDIASNKDGSSTEKLVGIASMDVSSFLRGELELQTKNVIRSKDEDSDSEIGFVEWSISINEPVLSDREIDFMNCVNVQIGQMRNLPQTWMDALSVAADDNNASNKKASSKHWLLCEWRLFDIEVQAKCDRSPKQVNENVWCLQWDFDAKYVLSIQNTQSLINAIAESADCVRKCTLKITHCFEDVNEVKQDTNYLHGEFDISDLFDSTESVILNSISLQLLNETAEESKQNDQETVNAAACSLDVKISFDTPWNTLVDALENEIKFEDVFTAKATIEKAATDTDNDENRNTLHTRECVQQIVDVLTEQRIQFLSQTSIEKYDHERLKQAFVYHLNTSGVYTQIKEKWLKPEISRYVNSMDRDTNSDTNTEADVFEGVLRETMKHLCETLNAAADSGKETEKTSKLSQLKFKLSIKKHTQIATDWQKIGDAAQACKHYELAYEETNKYQAISQEDDDDELYWQVLRNLIQIYTQQNRADEAIQILTDVVTQQTSAKQTAFHDLSILYLCALCVENGHENTKCILYQLQPNSVTASLLKCAYFAIQNDEIRSSVYFKKTLQCCNERKDELYAALDSLFPLNCFGIIDQVLRKFESSQFIDVAYHQYNARLQHGLKRYGTALSCIEDAIRIDDELPQLWARKGHVQFDADRKNDAMDAYRRHLQLCPGTAESLAPPPTDNDNDGTQTRDMVDKQAIYRLGRWYAEQKDFSACARTFLQGVEYEPDSWIFWSEAGDALFELRNYAECIQCYEQCNLINTDDSHAFCMLALCYLRLQQTPRAIQIMQETIKFGNDRVSKHDKQRVQWFGTELQKIGHVQSGKRFQNFII